MARESAIAINIPELAGLVDRWRVPTVEVATRGVPPHITLLYPWRAAPLRPSDLDQAMAALVGVGAFCVTLPRLGRFPGVLFLEPDPDHLLRCMIRRLVTAFPDTPPYGGAHGDPAPHLTLAKAATETELDRLQGEIVTELEPHLPLVIRVREIALAEEGEDGNWAVRATVALTDG